MDGFLIENTNKMDDDWGTPMTQEFSISGIAKKYPTNQLISASKNGFKLGSHHHVLQKTYQNYQGLVGKGS